MAKKTARKPATKPSVVPLEAKNNKYRLRIKRLEFVKASELLANEDNFRIHPGIQCDAVRGVMGEIGWVDAVLAFEEDGKLVLFDGHLRQGLEPDDMVPVLVTDLDRAEAKKVLATYDYITSLADIDETPLQSLVDDIDAEDAALSALIASLDKADSDPSGEGEEESDPEKEVPGMDLSVHEHYDYVVVLARTSQDWNILIELLGIEKRRDVTRRNTKIGVCLALSWRTGSLTSCWMTAKTTKKTKMARAMSKTNKLFEVCIPSHKRSDNMRDLLKKLPFAKIYVDEKEASKYKPVVPAENLVLRPSIPDCEWSQAVNWIYDNVECDCIVCLDDDFKRIQSKTGFKLKYTKPDDIYAIIENGYWGCRDLDLGVFCWCRSGNDFLTDSEFRPFRAVAPIAGCFGVMNKARDDRFDADLAGRSDIDFTLRRMLEDRAIYCDMRFYWDFGAAFSGTGGNVVHTTSEVFKTTTEKLKAKWGKHLDVVATQWGKEKKTANMSIRVNRKSPTANL